MKERIYEIRLTETTSDRIELQQSVFMSTVLEVAKASGMIGHGLEITWTNAED